MATDVSASEKAKARSAHSRINLPLNMKALEHLPKPVQDEVAWFHQHLLDEHLSRDAAEEAVDYKWNSIWQFLTGTNQGSYDNFIKRVQKYKRIIKHQESLIRFEFCENEITYLVFAGLDYAFANSCFQMVVGESGHGKTFAIQEWRRRHEGRSAYTDCPSVGGVSGFVRAVAHSVGVGQTMSITNTTQAVKRSFNNFRGLIVDNMHRSMPSDPRSRAAAFDWLQELHEDTGCPVFVSATSRLVSAMQGSHHMFEQFTGRVGIPLYLPEISENNWLPILNQFYKRPSAALKNEAARIVAEKGHLHQLTQRLKMARRIAERDQEDLSESHFFTAIAMRKEMEKNNPNQRKK